MARCNGADLSTARSSNAAQTKLSKSVIRGPLPSAIPGMPPGKVTTIPASEAAQGAKLDVRCWLLHIARVTRPGLSQANGLPNGAELTVQRNHRAVPVDLFSLSQRSQPVFRLRHATGKSIGIEYAGLLDVP